MRRPATLLAMVLLSLWLASGAPVARTGQDLRLGETPTSDAQLGGLDWTFVRIRYSSEANRLEQFRRIYLLERSLGNRRARGRAEPVPPDGAGHLDQGERPDRPGAVG